MVETVCYTDNRVNNLCLRCTLRAGPAAGPPPLQPLAPLWTSATLITIILLGIVEGVTEFIPVSSTGHLILAAELLGYDAAQWAVFNVVIQLGAILAVIVLYWRTFWAVLVGLLQRKPESWRFLRNVLVAFLPSAVLGFLLIDRIEAMLEQRRRSSPGRCCSAASPSC